jgi:hypothetical protein
MPLEKRDVEIPLGIGGVDTGRDDKIIDAPKFVQLENAEITDAGALQTRRGYKAHDQTAIGVTALTPVAIAKRGDAKVVISQNTANQANVVEYSSNASGWSGDEHLGSFVASESRTIKISGFWDLIPNDIAYNNGLLFISYGVDHVSADVWGVIVYDPATDTIVDDNVADGVFLYNTKLAALGDYVLAFYIDTDDDLQVRRIDSTDIASGWSAATEIDTDCDQSTYFDVHGDGTDAYIACQSVATPANARVFSVDEDLITNWSANWATSGAGANNAIAIHKHATASILMVVTSDSTNTQMNFVDSTDGSQDNTDTEAPTDVRNIIVGTETTDTFITIIERDGVVTSDPEDSYIETYIQTISTGASANKATGTYYNYGLAHKVTGDFTGTLGNKDQIQWGLTRASTYEAQIHTFEYTHNYTETAGRPIARYSRGLVNGEVAQGLVPTAAEDTTNGIIYFPFAGVIDVVNEDGTITTKSTVMLARYDEDDNKRLNHVEAQNGTIFSGAFPKFWDGTHLMSLGMCHSPTIISATSSAGTGSLNNNGVYQYKVTFEYRDAAGQLHRSAPSLPTSITLGASDDTVQLQVRSFPDYWERGKYNEIVVVAYRTADAGTVFYKLDDEDQTKNDTTYVAGGRAIDDETSDADLTNNALLYTEGGALDNNPPPPFETSVVHKNRLFVVDSETGDLAYSKEFLRGEGIAFSDEFRIPTGSHINRPVGIESMDENLIVFWEDKIGVVYGDGPNDLGEGGTFTLPRIVAYVGVKEDERRSIIKTPQGIFYKSGDGIKLLDRSMQVQDIGRDVIGLHTISGTRRPIVGGEHNQQKHQVMFAQGAGAGQAFVLVYDYLLNYWTRYIVNIDGTSNAIGSDLWDDEHVIVADAGTNRIFQQAVQFYDGNVSTVDTIDIVARTNWVKLDGLQGYQRVWRGWLLGNYWGPHALTVGVDFDYVQDGNSGSPFNIFNAINIVGDPEPYQFKFGIPHRQKCESIQFYIKLNVIGSPPYTVGTVQAELTSIRLEYGVAPRAMRIKNTSQT